MSSKRLRKLGFTFNREDYMDQITEPVSPALYHAIRASIRSAKESQTDDPLWGNELRRLLDLQLPNWILIAPTNGRFSRANAVEEAIAKLERRSGRIWTTATKLALGNLQVDPSLLPPLDRTQVEAAFFSWVRTNCAKGVQSPKPEMLPASPNDVFIVWDHVSKAMTYYFQAAIAIANNSLTHLAWFEDRVDTYLDVWLGGWIDRMSSKTRSDLMAAVIAGIHLVPVSRIWDFASAEIALQTAQPRNEVAVPDREAVEATFLGRVAEVCGPSLSDIRSGMREHDDTE